MSSTKRIRKQTRRDPTVPPRQAPIPAVESHDKRLADTDEDRYLKRRQALQVVSAMLLQYANSGEIPNAEELGAASGVIDEALEVFNELDIEDLLEERGRTEPRRADKGDGVRE